MLKVKSLEVFYGELQVLWDVSFDINQGEIVVLVGSNGAGKTTLLKALSGIQNTRSGNATFLDKDITNLSSRNIFKAGLVHVPEGRLLFNEMTIEDNLLIGSLYGEAKRLRYQTLEQCYSLFPVLKDRRRQLAGTLSGGEQQMTALARGLMANPTLLMLDEPSLGLAPFLVETIFTVIQKIRDEGITVLLVEQNVQATLNFCDRGYVLENGRITLTGTGHALLNDKRVKEAYLGL